MDLNARANDRRRGMAMVEMVFVLPVLLLLLFGVVEFGAALGQWQTLTNAAREGAREAIVFRVDCDLATVESAVQTRVANYAAAAGVIVAPGDIAVSGHCGDNTTNSQVTVTHTYTFRVVPGFAASVAPTLDLVGTSTMRNEGNG